MKKLFALFVLCVFSPTSFCHACSYDSECTLACSSGVPKCALPQGQFRGGRCVCIQSGPSNTLPVWRGTVGPRVRPWIPSVAPLAPVSAYQQGVKTGQQVPSTGTAIVRGLQGAVETYNRNKAREQQIRRQELEIQRLELELQQIRQLKQSRAKLQQDEETPRFKLSEEERRRKKIHAKYELWDKCVKENKSLSKCSEYNNY